MVVTCSLKAAFKKTPARSLGNTQTTSVKECSFDKIFETTSDKNVSIEKITAIKIKKAVQLRTASLKILRLCAFYLTALEIGIFLPSLNATINALGYPLLLTAFSNFLADL